MGAPIVKITPPSNTLAPADRRLLDQLEAKVESSLMDFAKALHQIQSHKDGLLWRSQGFASFEDYCRERFSFQKQHAYRLAAAGEFVSSLDTDVALPLRESQVRPIINKIPDAEKRVEFWKQLTSEKDPSTLSATAIEAEVLDYKKAHEPKPERQTKEKSSKQDRQAKLVEKARQRCLEYIQQLDVTAELLPRAEEIRELLVGLERLVKLKR